MIRRLGGVCAATLVLLSLTGCVERRMFVTTEPPGARVWINDTQAGVTPLTAEFTFHGTYDIRIEREGYEPLTTGARTEVPWWEYPPFDLVAELLPITLENEQRFHFDLTPIENEGLAKLDVESELLERAEGVRAQAAELSGEHRQAGEDERSETGSDGEG
ncbi:MAG: PEGA domain-containing protein [Planctomycetota bacterium]